MAQDKPTRKRKPKKAGKKQKKSFFVRGLIVLMPTVLTIIILVTVLQFVDSYLTSPINKAIYGFLDGNGFGWNVLSIMDIDPYDREFLDLEALPIELKDASDRYEEGTASAEFLAALTTFRDEKATFFRDFGVLAIDKEKLRDATKARVPPIIGIIISAAVVLTLGYLASGFLGRRLIAAFDRGLNTIPIIRSVYPYTKQLVDFFLSDNELEFDTVVAAPYPSEGVWAIGFVTSPGLKTVHEELGDRYLSVFIPTSPVPMTGFTVFIRADRLIPLNISVDEALRITVSAGVLVPQSEKVEELAKEVEDIARAQEGEA